MFPLASIQFLGKAGIFALEVVIGFLFGFALEISGFSNSYVLTGQFYFRNGRVIKTMFTSIVVAMVLIFGASALGILDYDSIFVDLTYLWPGLIGGALMGIAIVIGGYCPGTSLVSSAALKKDAWFFVLGGIVGGFLFDELEPLFHYFYYSSDYGRLTLMDVFHVNAGLIVFIITVVAVALFWFNEWLVNRFKREDTQPYPTPRWLPIFSAVALVLATAVWLGWPSWEQRWKQVAAEQALLLEQNQVQIHPGELADSLNRTKSRQTVVIDVRDDYAYNLFHLRWSRHIPLEQLEAAIPEFKDMVKATPATVFVIVSNGGEQAIQAWKMMAAYRVPNIYILDGGLNEWVKVFGEEDLAEGTLVEAQPGANPEAFGYYCEAALGARYRSADMLADPDNEEMLEKVKEQFVPKIKVKGPSGPVSGGCG